MSPTLNPSLPLTRPTSKEQEKAAAYLVSTRDDLLDTVRDLTINQWTFTSESSEWCIADIVEHLAIVEGRIHAIIARMPEASLSDSARVDSEVDAMILTEISTRTNRVNAPAFITPTGKSSPSEAVRDFREKRNETLRLLESAPCLRGRVIPHPIMGPWDGYQWILSTAAHTERHLNQIMELTTRRSFPANG